MERRVSRRDFVRTLGAAGVVGSGARSASAYQASGAIAVGSRRQLLFDDFMLAMGGAKLEDYPHNIRWVLGKVEKSTGNTLLGADQPWEESTAWVSVLYDGGRYRLWYNASSPGEQGLFVAYAESKDGLNWRKPVLNLIEKGGSKRNNIVYTGGPDGWTVEMGNVFVDAGARPEERYKMIYSTWDTRHVYPNDGLPFVAEAGVMRGAYSPDGLHWTRYPHIFQGRYSDTQNVAAFDADLGKYVAYIRSVASYGGLKQGAAPVAATRRGRAVGRMESEDYVRWSHPELAVVPDFEDGLNVEIYNSAYSRYGGADRAHFLFPSFYQKRQGTFQVGVAVSRDNVGWMRPARGTLIPLGEPGAFDDFIISVAPGFVPAGQDRVALYYRSGNGPHAGAIAGVKAQVGKPRQGMGRVVFRRDRLVGIEAGAEEGTFATRPLLFEGRRLVVNAEPVGQGAELRVRLVGVGVEAAESQARGKYMDDAVAAGFGFEDCVPVTGDGLDAEVRWAGAELGKWVGKPVRLQFRMRSMRVYGFQFVD